MVHFNVFFWISVFDERKCNKAVHEELIQLIVLTQMCNQVSTVVELRLQYVLLIKTQGTYMTEIADFIQFFKSLDWLPDFFHNLHFPLLIFSIITYFFDASFCVLNGIVTLGHFVTLILSSERIRISSFSMQAFHKF